MIIMINYYIKYSVNFGVTTMNASNVSLLFFRLIYTISIYIQASRLKSSTLMHLWSLVDLLWFCEAVLLNHGHNSVILRSSADLVRSFILLNKAPDCSFGHYLILSVGFSAFLVCNDINQLCLDHNISKIAGAFDCLPPSIYFTLGPVCDVNMENSVM